jgi:hypothetical protein
VRPLLVLALFLTSIPCLAGAWTKPAGGGYGKLGSATFVSDHGYDDRGERVSDDSFRMHAQTLFAYGELGLTDDIMLVGFAPYVLATNGHSSGVRFHTAGTGDLMGGVQVTLLRYQNLVVSARAELKVPLYEGAPSLRGRQTAWVKGFPRSSTFFPALGDGQVDVTGFLSAGASLPWVKAFLTADVGYRLRTGDITDAGVVIATGGFWALERRLLLLVNSISVLTLPSDDERRVMVGKGFWAVGPAAMIFVTDRLALEVGCDLVTRGVNAAGGVQVLTGVSYAF